MKRVIAGVVLTAIIGGSTYSINQSDVVNHLAENSGLTQQQAQKYVNGLKDHLVTFHDVGEQLVSDGMGISGKALAIDCVNYTYPWASPSLSCEEGKREIDELGSAEMEVGSCYSALSRDLNNLVRQKIGECIRAIDRLELSIDTPMISKLLGETKIASAHKMNQYNKAILQSATLQK